MIKCNCKNKNIINKTAKNNTKESGDWMGNIRKKEGITLIALVITIIILLILAGVTIATLTGENGLIKKALKAKEETEIQAYCEKIELIRNELRLQNTNYEPPKLEQLEMEFNNNQTEWVKKVSIEAVEKIDTIILITKEGYIFHVTENGTKYIAKGEITKATQPKVKAKTLDTTSCIRKTQKYFADLFEIEWASDGEGNVEYIVNRKSRF